MSPPPQLVSGKRGRIKARGHRSLTFEKLEDRSLLSRTFFNDAGEIIRQEGARPVADPGADIVDFGDFFWHFEAKIPFLRSRNEVVVSFKGKPPVGLSELAGFEILHAYDASTIVYRTMARGPTAETRVAAALAGLRTRAEVEWAGSVLYEPERGERLVVGDEISVKLENGLKPDAIFGTEIVSFEPIGGERFLVRVRQDSPMDPLRLADRFHQMPEVVYAHPNYRARVIYSTNDPLFGNQWHLNNTGQTNARVDADGDVVEAWNTTVGSANTVIAVIDNGIELTHPDLDIFVNAGEIPNNSIDDDNNGYPDDDKGWDFRNNDRDASADVSQDWHGTAVAGIAAGRGENALGVTGVSQRSKVLPIKISNGLSFATAPQIANAIYYAAGRTANLQGTWRGADVINISWFYPGTPQEITDAINWAATSAKGGQGVPVFAASGNDASGEFGEPIGYFDYQIPFPQAGNYIFEWEYIKNGSVTQGDDTVWLAYVRLPNGTIQQFDTQTFPTGWTTAGNALWTIADDPAHAYGTGRYVFRSGDISDNQSTRLRTNSIAVPANGTISFRMWVSSEFNDILWFRYSTNGGASFTPALLVNEVPAVDTNVDFPASVPNAIAVGSSTDWDYRAAYTEFSGTPLDFLAPSGGGYSAGVTTTDLTGSNGFNNTTGTAGNYTTNTAGTTFGGTSAATPYAAGVAALMLSKNPHISAANIRSIMRSQTDQVGGNIGLTTYVNGFNQYYGYGRVNADKAVRKMGPTVTSVVVSNTGSVHAAYTIPDRDDVPGQPWAQLKTVPVGGGINRIAITFDETLTTPFPGASLELKGGGGFGAVIPTTLVSYNGATRTATWSFTLVHTNQLRIKLDGNEASANRIRDANGNTLDGEWVNPTSFSDTNAAIYTYPSGNGQPGGDFSFYVTVLRGDVNRDGLVSSLDHIIIASNLGMGPPATPNATWEQGDVSGDGRVGLTDLIQYRNNIGIDYRNWPTGMMAMSSGDSSAAEEARRESDRFLRSLVASGRLTESEVDEVWKIFGEG